MKTFAGPARQVGKAYATHFQREIAGFFSQEFGSYRYAASYVRACSEITQKSAPNASAFIEGAARGSLLSADEHTLLLLHEEELYHRKLKGKLPHCSAIAVRAQVEKFSGAILGQNWDWNTAYFPWMSVNRFAISGKPIVVALSFPGLPICAGLNSSGMALMWTGAGYYPPLTPRVGVPTYALVLEALLKPDVPSALDYLASVKNAGAFIFVLGDKAGRLAVVEATPGRIFVEKPEFAYRSNVYASSKALAASKQNLPSATRCHSLKRNKIFAESFRYLRTKPNVKNVKSILSHPNILIEKTSSHATLMQLVADCRGRKLMLRSWRQRQQPWVEIRV